MLCFHDVNELCIQLANLELLFKKPKYFNIFYTEEFFILRYLGFSFEKIYLAIHSIKFFIYICNA